MGEPTTEGRRLQLPAAAWALLAGSFVSALGDRLVGIAFMLYAAEIGSMGLLTAILIADMLPPVLFGLLGGVVSDFHMRRWLWPVALAIQGSCYLVLGFVSGHVTIVALVAVGSTVAAILGPIGSKVLHEVAGRDGRHAVARVLAVSTGISGIAGVVLGGFAFGLTDRAWLFGAKALAFLAMAVIVAVLRLPIPPPAEAADGGRVTIRDALAGITRLWTPAVFGRIGLLLLTAVMFGTSLEGIVAVFFLQNEMLLSAGTFGLALGTWALGIIIGGALRLPDRRHLQMRHLFFVAAGVMGMAILAVPLFQHLWVLFPAYLLGGVANGVFNSGLTTMMFHGIPNEFQGRAWAGFALITNVVVLGGYLAGSLGGEAGARTMMIAAGALPTAVAIVALTLAPRRATFAADGRTARG